MESMVTSFEKLDALLDELPEGTEMNICTDEWSVKDLLAVRIWWSEQISDWVHAGFRNEIPDLPAKGYKWSETPALNNAIVRDNADIDYAEIRQQLNIAFKRIQKITENLSEEQLMKPFMFEWAGKWPVARWISISTTRQYTTAATYVRKVLASVR